LRTIFSSGCLLLLHFFKNLLASVKLTVFFNSVVNADPESGVEID
jgi:hypothetical protein